MHYSLRARAGALQDTSQDRDLPTLRVKALAGLWLVFSVRM